MLLHVSVAAAVVDIFHMGFLLAADNNSDNIHIFLSGGSVIVRKNKTKVVTSTLSPESIVSITRRESLETKVLVTFGVPRIYLENPVGLTKCIMVRKLPLCETRGMESDLTLTQCRFQGQCVILTSESSYFSPLFFVERLVPRKKIKMVKR